MSIELITLFVNGQPVVYEVTKDQSSYFFTPLTSWQETLEATSFMLHKVKGQWEAVGIEDKDVIDQAIEEVENLSF